MTHKCLIHFSSLLWERLPPFFAMKEGAAWTRAGRQNLLGLWVLPATLITVMKIIRCEIISAVIHIRFNCRWIIVALQGCRGSGGRADPPLIGSGGQRAPASALHLSKCIWARCLTQIAPGAACSLWNCVCVCTLNGRMLAEKMVYNQFYRWLQFIRAQLRD